MGGYTGPAALVLMVGAPGSGKSTFTAERFPATQIVSLDRLRGELTDDEGDQSANAEVSRLARLRVAYRLRRGLTTVVDATHAVRADRERLCLRARACGMPTVAVVLYQPVEICVGRQDTRDRKVPVDVIRTMHAAITADLHRRPVGWLHPCDITRTVTPGADTVCGRIPADMAGAPWFT